MKVSLLFYFSLCRNIEEKTAYLLVFSRAILCIPHLNYTITRTVYKHVDTMAENVRNIIDEIVADSDSDGEENFEGFDF